MQRTDDAESWYTAWLNTPFRGKVHRETHSPSEAFKLPGNAVKAQHHEPGTFPETGVLVSFDVEKNEVVVRAHHDMGERWIWRGTRAEYLSTWEVD